MLLKSSPFLCPASCDKSMISLLCNDVRNVQLKSRIDCQNSKISAAGINSFEGIDKELEMPLTVESGMGIGITNYFQGKNIFLTGATGLLGKVLVEKMLRSTPIGKIYVLVKADDPEAAIDRVQKELINSDLFESIQEIHGKDYQEFMKEKLVAVVGNIYEPNLGMDSDSARAIMEDVNVIIQSAAVTTVNERYDVLLDANVNGPQILMRFAKTCKNLELLVHVSTVYVNGEKEGLVLEKPLIIGENRRNDNGEIGPTSFPPLDIGDELNLVLRSRTAASNFDTTKDMKRLGMERARLYGWYNAYHLTKAMAEMVIHETRGDIPVLIIRPSLIESCYREPYPGWIQGNRMLDPLIISYGKGQLPAFLCKPDTPLDVIPLDLVVNTMIAAIAKHGYTRKSELNVYQLASSLVNPLRFSDFFEYIGDYFSSDPLIESESFIRMNYYDNVTNIKYVDNVDDFSKYTREEIFARFGSSGDDLRLHKQCKAKVAYADHLCKVYGFLGFFNARFHVGNTHNLLSEMSEEEKMSFPIDVREINWRKYFQEIHIPGLRKHVLNDKRIPSL
ncbi:fatty acyl-CoA reductase 2, chloroplastic-like [Salvia miltiorrhiza]|uniref:fatty acyl-CoA reductase 2, chloroplastic-like n=1 Tax=Salvia miltiorrhiza TaxID=226208 RepID=UPI0025AC8B2D|nr:fatty acyl-CoA reductase 2, chloroplastic-like [Salvia miltiorrhiza]